jgi:heme-degrading monooxygenase HmoA
METVLIDTFIVPEESKTAFLDGARKVQSFIRTLPGFVEGFLYEKKDGESRHNFLTTAVWESEEAFENAKGAVAIEFQEQGFNPQETRQRLKIESVRSTYERSPY